MIVRPAHAADRAGFLALAAEVEHWFGPMVDEPGFHAALDEHIRTGLALVVPADPGPGLLGGLLFGAEPPVHHVHWLVVAGAARGRGVGRALMAEAARRYVRGPGTVELITFGLDHPGAIEGGSRAFYESLGFVPAESAEPGPEGGSRQVFRRTVD
ncbi:GNAT family N-acetyltransferase [Embleya sp. NBC_00888]|uniref:GNAT family N-acetyltransferase n=1 Tax=Embleya sp. NBC_00888 TaxID=2975960 RepID=UPI0038672286|nr:GNAT family N-acetyltransferase [Embleya sp. NBC_00888]